nr:zf-HC2 domain-containing protein [Actinomycetota bacterium]
MTAHTPDDLLAATVDGTLSEADRHAVETHLRTCARCRDQVEAAGRARAVLKALPAELAPPIEVAAAVAARIGSGRATVVARPAA